MEFTSPLIKGTLVKRYKRFLADIVLENGSLITAHCPNTGAMTGCDIPGSSVYVRFDNNPKRKLAYTWELAVDVQNNWIGINTHNANKLVEEWLNTPDNTIPTLFTEIKREAHYAGSASRFDFACLDKHGAVCHLIEVKSVTLLQNNNGWFPDAVTARGAKHCNELAQIAETGMPCSLIFCAQHTGIKKVSPASHIDPTYTESLYRAARAGVNIIALGCIITQEKIVINQRLAIKM